MEDPKELGTLIVVVGKARNLPNKSRFGKQDPFCTVQFLEDKKRTRTIKRGGQHPEWDDELRFTIMEELEDILKVSRSESLADSTVSSSASLASVAGRDSPAGVTTAQALAAKSRRPFTKKGGGKNMRVACYADDPKEPELIGDCYVQIDEVLKKGEVDEWYEFTYKEKYVGEIYLELTFYSNDAPPVKRNVPKPAVHNYGGAGVFHDGTLSTSSSLSGRLSASGSASGMNLYIPPYAAQHAVSPPAAHPQSYGSFGNLGIQPEGMNDPNQDFAPGMPGSIMSSPTPGPSATMSSLDSLTRPFSAMSFGESAPPTPPKTINPSASTVGLNRHSLGVSDAPWVALLPQTSNSSPAPVSRPMSTNDALPWEQAKRFEDERRRGGMTPVPRPLTAQIRPGDTIPAALQAGVPPIRHEHAHSFSYSDRPIVTSLLHASSPSPAPLAASAPPIVPNGVQYQHSPLSSFERVALALNTSAQSSPHGQASLASRPQSLHDPLQTPIAPYQPTPPRLAQDYPAPPGPQNHFGVGDSRTDAYQQLYDHLDPTGATTPAATYSHQIPSMPQTPQHQINRSYTPSSSLPGSATQHTTQYTPPPNLTPPPQPVQHATSSGSYVPWYQQTQSAQQNVQGGPVAPPYPETATPGGFSHVNVVPHPAFGPPPVPDYRPAPTPSGSTVGHGQGYYPSDELYVRSANGGSEVYSAAPPVRPGPTPSPGPSRHVSRHSYHGSPSTMGYQVSSYASQSPTPPPPQGPSAFDSLHSFSPPPIPQNRPSDFGPSARARTPLNSGPAHPSSPFPDYRPPQSPAPPPQLPYTPSPHQPYAQSHSAPPLPPPRTPSPLPPPRPHELYATSSEPQVPISTLNHLGPLPPAKSPLINHHHSLSAPPQDVLPSSNRHSWKSYMQALPTTSPASLAAHISGLSGAQVSTPIHAYPPTVTSRSDAKDIAQVAGQYDQYGQVGMPGGFAAIGTPQGSMGNSAKPPKPDGWRSTLPAQVNGHQWSG
ncbi:hypothetical protein BD324DRAFT_620459 [Kockovaella imperatae]|uniref:C2 domain-containing protein n=1 Tax=Kockovaella imperatae TaxID=4999 RepID=A0A1Y1UK22_9TREE|nr:hypothetical protein BD324DRAFT_620459 [Kockovaella imperatae]ORX38332.1 hypothetical protein BD324DRAFT_620459 [Kockovaella imperatae]